jgi:lipid II:glycine glycyltransferase (peptidoglycan interpeptide bridge formation enzyme)
MIIKPVNINELSKISDSVFLSEKWLAMYDGALLPYGIFDKNDKITGGFILYKEKRKMLSYFRNPPYMPHTGLFFENKASNKAKRYGTAKKYLKLVADFVNGLPYDVLTIALPPEIIDTQPFFWQNFKVIPNYTYIIELEQPEKDIISGFASERRNDLKRADKDNIITKHISDMKIVKDLVSKTFDRKNKSIDDNMLDKILFDFSSEENSFAFASFKNDKPIACAFCIYDNHKTYYLLGGYDSQNKHQGAGSKAFVESILFAKKKGIPLFDFEGSMLQEVEHYFRGFGGTLTPYYTLNKGKLFAELALKYSFRAQF